MHTIKHFLDNVREVGWIGALKRFYALSEIKSGTLVGMDKAGNRYYESKDEVFGRDRWVIFNTTNYDASFVPPEWHAWLHRMSDIPGTEMKKLEPVYKENHHPNSTGTPDSYSPNNFILNENWRKKAKPLFDSWKPPGEN